MVEDGDNLIPVERLLQKRREVEDLYADAVPTVDMTRSRRRRTIRGRTVSVKRMPLYDLEPGLAEARRDAREGIVLPQRPKTRGECEAVERPCPFVSCKHNLYLDVIPSSGAIKFNTPDLEPDQMPADASCSLDVADQGGETLERVGEMLNLTRERTRQIEAMACAKVSDMDARDGTLAALVERGVTRGTYETDEENSDDPHGASYPLFRALNDALVSRPKVLARSVPVGANGLRIGDVVPKEKP